MKMTLLLLLFSLKLWSCLDQNKPNLKLENHNPKQEQNFQKENLELQRVSERLTGILLPQEYVNELIKSKSAYFASKFIPDIAELQIDPKNIQADSLVITSSLGNQEGYTFKIWIENHDSKPFIQTNLRNWDKGKTTSTLKYTLGADTSIVIEKRDISGKIIQTINFTRVGGLNQLSQFGGLGYEYLARKIMLNGQYALIDSINQKRGTINLDLKSGNVTGLKFKKYELQTDFGTGLEYKGDLLTFLPNADNYKNAESFAIKIKNDTLQLWTTEEDSNDFSKLKLKTLKYSLIKVEK